MIGRLKNIPYWRVASKTDVDKLFPGRNKMVQAMKDLYPIVEAQVPKIMHEKWNIQKSDRLVDVFPTFLQVVESVVYTPMSGFQILYDGKYYLDVYCYPDLKQDYVLYYASFGFLPKLYHTNRKLYKICLEVFRLLATSIGCWGFDSGEEDDHFVEQEIENMAYDEDMPESDKAVIRNIIDEYHKNGTKYYQLIYEPTTAEKVRRLMDNYDVTLEIEQLMFDCFEWLLKADAEPGNMNYFDEMAIKRFALEHDLPEDENGNFDFPDGSPVSPGMAMRYGWFGYEGFKSMQTQWLGDVAGNFGQANYSINYDCRKPGDIKQARNNYYKETGRFLEHLGKFYSTFEEIEHRIYHLAEGRLTEILFKNGATKERLRIGEGVEGL